MEKLENANTYTLDTPEGRALIARFQEKTNYLDVSKIVVVDKYKWYITYQEEDIADVTDKDIIFKKVTKTTSFYWSQYPYDVERQRYVLTGKCRTLIYDVGGQSYVVKDEEN